MLLGPLFQGEKSIGGGHGLHHPAGRHVAGEGQHHQQDSRHQPARLLRGGSKGQRQEIFGLWFFSSNNFDAGSSDKTRSKGKYQEMYDLW